MIGLIIILHTFLSCLMLARRCISSLKVGDQLEENKENIVVVHCIAGKGRTGSLISAYMLYVNAFTENQKAIVYYKEKR